MELNYTSNDSLFLIILIVTYFLTSILFIFSIFKAGSSLLKSSSQNESDNKNLISKAGKWLKRAAIIWAFFIILIMYALSCNFY